MKERRIRHRKGLIFFNEIDYNDSSESAGSMTDRYYHILRKSPQVARGNSMIRKHILLVGLLGALAFLLVACGDGGTALSVREVGTVTGHVIDVSLNEPMPGVAVHIKSMPFITDTSETGTIEITTLTDQNGTFYRVDVPVGDVQVSVSRNGFRTPPAQEWVLFAGGIGEIDFEMSPGTDPPEKFEGDDQSAWPPDKSDF